MKQKDIAVIIAVVFFSAMVAYVLTNQFIVSSNTKKLTAEEVAPISPDFNIPDKKVFNSEAINPTQLIKIEPNENTQPFSNQ